MKIYPDTLEYASWTITADTDLSAATVEAFIANDWQSLTWTGSAVQTGDNWTRSARILVSGANPDDGVSVKPGPGNTYPLVRVTVGGEVIVTKGPSGDFFSVV